MSTGGERASEPVGTSEDAPPVPAGPEEVQGWPVTWSRGQQVVHVTRDGYRDLVAALADDGFTFCCDVTAVDYLAHPDRPVPAAAGKERFEVVVGLLSPEHRRRIRIRAQVPESDPRVPSLFELHPGTEAMEREVFDLVGIVFEGHPDLTRILMPEDWEGHPLRKDYAVGRIPVQFKAAPGPR